MHNRQQVPLTRRQPVPQPLGDPGTEGLPGLAAFGRVFARAPGMIEVGMGGDQFGLGAAGPAAHLPFAQARVRGAVAMADEFRRLPRAVEIGRDHESGIQRPHEGAKLPHQRQEEQTSELTYLMSTSNSVFRSKKMN